MGISNCLWYYRIESRLKKIIWELEVFFEFCVLHFCFITYGTNFWTNQNKTRLDHRNGRIENGLWKITNGKQWITNRPSQFRRLKKSTCLLYSFPEHQSTGARCISAAMSDDWNNIQQSLRRHSSSTRRPRVGPDQGNQSLHENDPKYYLRK